jgi:eukaryotic-like serine/threonine-protein kinase
LGLRAARCGNGEVLFDEQLQPAKKDEVLNSLSQLAGKFRTKAGESLATVKEHSAWLTEATTPLEAWKLYCDALKVAVTENNAGANSPSSACCSNRSQIRDGVCVPGPQLRR